MENLSPCLNLCWRLRRSLEIGESPRLALRSFAEERGEFPDFCRRWMEHRDRGADHLRLLNELPSASRRNLLTVTDRALSGHPVLPALRELQAEIEDLCRDEIERHLTRLPFQMLVPLLFFLFPAIMILILAPLLDLLAEGFAF